MQHRFFPEPAGLFKAAAEAVATSIAGVLTTRPSAVLGIPGGRSAAAIFEELVEHDVEWRRVQVFMVDERLVPLDSPKSNYRVARTSLIEPLFERGDLPRENVHPFVPDPTAADGGAEAYTQALAGLGGVYDVLLLSAGEDGHVASLFPHHPALDAAAPHVLVEDAPKPPLRRMTISRTLLVRAQAAVLLFVGEGKRTAYRAFCDEGTEDTACPARFVLEIPQVYVLTDIRTENV